MCVIVYGTDWGCIPSHEARHKGAWKNIHHLHKSQRSKPRYTILARTNHCRTAHQQTQDPCTANADVHTQDGNAARVRWRNQRTNRATCEPARAHCKHECAHGCKVMCRDALTCSKPRQRSCRTSRDATQAQLGTTRMVVGRSRSWPRARWN